MIKELIVVEGKSDIDFLSSFIDGDFYQVRGSAITTDDINFLKQVNTMRGIIVLTDPDFPGLQIRNKISSAIPGCKHAFVRKEVSIKHHKVGVAESTKDEVLNALKNAITIDKKVNRFTTADLYMLGLTGRDYSYKLRKLFCDSLKIGFSNGKELLLKLNSINITYDEVEEMVHKCLQEMK